MVGFAHFQGNRSKLAVPLGGAASGQALRLHGAAGGDDCGACLRSACVAELKPWPVSTLLL